MTEEEKEFRRMDDQLMGQLIQKLDDSIEDAKEWREIHDKVSFEWRASIDDRLKPVEDFVKGAGWIWKILLGIAALGAFAVRVYEWVHDHMSLK